MKKIKFRAWDKKLKKFVRDFWLDSDGSLYYPDTDNKSVRDLAPLMEYTGLKDKNDKEIYEGDIIKYKGGVGEVVFEKGSYYIKNFETNEAILGLRQAVEIQRGIVIGNKFENKELLE